MGVDHREAGEVEGDLGFGRQVDEAALDLGGVLREPDEPVGVVSGEVGFDEVLGDGVGMVFARTDFSQNFFCPSD